MLPLQRNAVECEPTLVRWSFDINQCWSEEGVKSREQKREVGEAWTLDLRSCVSRVKLVGCKQDTRTM